MRFTLIVFATAFGFISTAFAADDLIQLDLAAKPFGPQKTAVLHAINTDAKYSEITAEKRSVVTKALDSISAVLSDDKSLSAVDTASREQILANQHLINAALEQAKQDSRMVCTREAVIGTNMPKRVCRTAAARRKMYDESQDAMKTMQKPQQNR